MLLAISFFSVLNLMRLVKVFKEGAVVVFLETDNININNLIKFNILFFLLNINIKSEFYAISSESLSAYFFLIRKRSFFF